MPYSFPQLPSSEASRDFQETFGGYNHNLRISDNEFFDMKNMTGDYYPVLSPRGKRAKVPSVESEYEQPQTMIWKDALCHIARDDVGVHLYINGDLVTAFEGKFDSDSQFKMIGMGAYLLIFEDTGNGLDNGWYINTVDKSEHGFIDNTYEKSLRRNDITAVLTMCGRDGEDYNNITVSDTAPTSPTNGQKWLDTSGEKHYLKVYAATTAMWTTVSTTYVKISCPQIAADFKEGDAVQISGLHATRHTEQDASTKSQLEFLNNTAIIQSIDESVDQQGNKNNGWIVIVGILDKTVHQEGGTIKVERKAPLLDFVCECNNRLWGCRYGLNRERDKTVNEIYACKQADFKNWFCYAGISTDSYATSVGSDGVWTGAVHYGREVLFFKEECIHKLYGSMPSDYQLIEIKHRGVQRGSEKSIVCVNETLFYKSTADVCFYDGSLPTSISYPLGEQRFFNAVAGSIGNKYYINMQDYDGNYSLFVYDISRQLWHKEDDVQIKEFCRVDNSLYAIIGNDLISLTGGTPLIEDDFEWYAETGYIGYAYSDNKYVGRLLVRLSKPLTSKISLYLSYDNMDTWEQVAEISGGGTRSFSIPVIPRRCDRFRVRIKGVGDCKIYSISKVLDIGSDA
jgi:hypothetical protein